MDNGTLMVNDISYSGNDGTLVVNGVNYSKGGTDVSDTTAEPKDVKKGKYFYNSNGERTEGANDGQQTLVKVWENEDDSKSFTAKTISLDLSGKAGVMIYIRNSTSSSAHNRLFVNMGETRNLWGSNNAGNRSATVSETGVVFGAGKNDSTTNNAYAVPTSIYVIADATEVSMTSYTLDE